MDYFWLALAAATLTLAIVGYVLSNTYPQRRRDLLQGMGWCLLICMGSCALFAVETFQRAPVAG